MGAYSRGMRQRLGIAEVLVKDPQVVFLDEPTLGLDPDGTQKMLDFIVGLGRDKGITVFFSSHLLDQVQRISDRVGIMLKGQPRRGGPHPGTWPNRSWGWTRSGSPWKKSTCGISGKACRRQS